MANAIRIRMYRVGFGDCFLLTLQTAGGPRHILIDFGVHPGGDAGMMPRVLADIKQETGGQLALLVVTHAHRDHVSGFASFTQDFAAFQIGELWMPWTENPNDTAAVAAKNNQAAFYNSLQRNLQKQPPAGISRAEMRAREAAMAALANLAGTRAAMAELQRGFGTGTTPLYRGAGESFDKVGGVEGLSIDVLGPPKDRALLKRMDPPASQRYLAAGAAADNGVDPFPKMGAAKASDADIELTPEYLEQLRAGTETPDSEMALAWDQMVNNTSLVLLFRFQGRNLLFAGDAQWGNWARWVETGDAKTILASIDFLKIAHHGSHNGTPRSVVENLDKSKIAVMISTQDKPFPSIPRGPLLSALSGYARAIVRSDSVHIAGIKDGPEAGAPVPAGFTKGKFWIDYEL